MERLGINWALLASQVALLLLIVFLPALLTLLHLRKGRLADTARVLWVAIIVLIPWMGSAAYWIIRPGSRSNTQRPPA